MCFCSRSSCSCLQLLLLSLLLSLHHCIIDAATDSQSLDCLSKDSILIQAVWAFQCSKWRISGRVHAWVCHACMRVSCGCVMHACEKQASDAASSTCSTCKPHTALAQVKQVRAPVSSYYLIADASITQRWHK